ncbi:hypothetical protein LTR50_006163 [Elasticomyces elasticus]|nr:hypothetical protein LTR50_006163 [Elasticomyces elasticus]
MRPAPQLKHLNPLRLLPRLQSARYPYERLPLDSRNGSPFSTSPPKQDHWLSPKRIGGDRWRMRVCRTSPVRLLLFAVTLVLLFALLAAGAYRVRKERGLRNKPAPRELFAWEHFSRLNGYYNGIRSLVPISQYMPDNRYNASVPPQPVSGEDAISLPTTPLLNPEPFNPYPQYDSEEYLRHHVKVETCYLDEASKTPAPETYAYPGLPQHMSVPFLGSYKELGLTDSKCFDRYSRFAPYGYGYNASAGGLGLGNHSEKAGSEKVFAQSGLVDYRKVDWGTAQRICYEKNKERFEGDIKVGDQNDTATAPKKKIGRQAYVLRTWSGYYYNEHQIFSLRAMINELSLRSGGEYDVHFLVHIKDDSIPIWADAVTYQQTLEANVPREFWNISTLWSEAQMKEYYPGPFTDNFANMAGSSIHGVYRSAHFALQWFAQQYPEYEFYWNWEMDIRYTGHYYEFNDRIGEWARQQPRKGLWERSERFYIPGHHGDWTDFTQMVERETRERGEGPVWGPVNDFENTGMLPPPNATARPPRQYHEDNFEWGVGEDADLIVFNPIFKPNTTNWVFRLDVTGYNLSCPVPPRRAAIVTVARLSNRLLSVMHEETWRMKHTMFPEMWPPTVCLHHGLKAVYAPHPIYFDHDWPLDYMDRVFNHQQAEHESPFGWGEHNLFGSSFYYSSGFSGALWRRWLGQQENGEGGARSEKMGSGRMCLRSALFHPIKHETNSAD